MPRIVLLPGDGVGPEITAAARRVLDAVVTVDYEERPLGLRKALGLYANLRPVRPVPALADASPLKREVLEGTDLLVVRELTGGIYFGEKAREGTRARDVCEYDTAEIERIARTAFKAARTRVTSVDKMNVLETSRLWREVVARVHREEFPTVELEHQLVDSAAMKLVAAPRHARDAPERLARRRRPGPVRARARVGAGHRRPRHRQPARHDPLRGAPPAPRTGDGGRGGCRRIGGW